MVKKDEIVHQNPNMNVREEVGWPSGAEDCHPSVIIEMVSACKAGRHQKSKSIQLKKILKRAIFLDLAKVTSILGSYCRYIAPLLGFGLILFLLAIVGIIVYLTFQSRFSIDSETPGSGPKILPVRSIPPEPKPIFTTQTPYIAPEVPAVAISVEVRQFFL